MSYQVLARKWRPRSFDQVVGQQHVLQALVNALDNNRLHHAYLFSGTRGVGKTSIARLLAKALNCEQSVSAQPCGVCQSCIEIDQGNFVDLIEIDAASKTKVEDTRDILDNVQYKPSRGRYKVYLIDEVHMLSRSSFNALLKTLEEPPEHVKFLFATTEAQKLPVTILSRCLQFNLKAISSDQIAKQLEHILQQEQVDFDLGALSLIANAADGSMRDALSLTDQGIAFGNGTLAIADVTAMLGSLETGFSTELIMLAAQQDGDLLFSKIEELSQFAPDYDQLLKQMSKDVHLAALSQIVKSSARLGDEPKAIVALAAAVNAEMLQLFYHILLQGRKELAYAPDPRSGFEMVLLRLIAFMPKPAMPVSREPSTDDELDLLTSQQQGILQQAKVLTATTAAQISPAVKPEHMHQVHEAIIAPVTSSKISTASMGVQQPVTQSFNESAPASSAGLENQRVEPAGNIAKPVVNQSSVAIETNVEQESSEQEFSEQDMLNMSYAMAEEEQGDHHQFSAEPVQDIAPPAANDGQSSTGISDFLAARKVLRSKVSKEPESSVKKPLAVKTPSSPKQSRLSARADSSLPQSDIPQRDLPQNDLAKSDRQNQTQLTAPQHFEIKPAARVTDTRTTAVGQNYQPTQGVSASGEMVVDPATLLAPNTDDPWSLLIDDMELTGRLRLLAMQSSYLKQEQQVSLLLRSEHRHLLAASASEQLEQKLRLHFSADINLTVEIGSDQQLTPDQLAVNLHQQRLGLAQQCIGSDASVAQFEQKFGAQVNLESINYRKLKNII
ncbi:MAG: DNA polymerase III subunit gamma/tau [Gammaproteobacteria bacterium]|nr:DNA polymerase III subunit gamma/tau [Gammaproteobacteria bacterium]